MGVPTGSFIVGCKSTERSLMRNWIVVASLFFGEGEKVQRAHEKIFCQVVFRQELLLMFIDLTVDFDGGLLSGVCSIILLAILLTVVLVEWMYISLKYSRIPSGIESALGL